MRTIVLLHGMWCTGADWWRVKQTLESYSYTCFAPTLPYHELTNRAPHPELSSISVADYVRFLEAYIHALPLDSPPVLIGHSMGGLLAQMLAARGLAHRLVLLCPAHPAGIFAITRSGVRALSSVVTPWRFWHKPHLLPFNKACYAIFNNLSPDAQQLAYNKRVYESGRALFEIAFWYADRTRVTRVDPAQICCPVYVVAGGKDKLVPASLVRRIARRYPHATYREYPNNAHWILDEDGTEEIVGDIHSWLLR